MVQVSSLNGELQVTSTYRGVQGRVLGKSPWTDSELERLLCEMEDCVAGARTPTAQVVQRAGQDLFDAVFCGPVRDDFMRCVGWVEGAWERTAQASPVRVLIEALDETAQKLPWEALYWAGRNAFLARDPYFTVARSLASRAPYPQIVRPPLRCVFFVNAPEDQTRLGLDRITLEEMCDEAKMIRDALAPLAGDVECEPAICNDLEKFQHRMRMTAQHPVHVVHLIGHADFRDGAGQILIAGKEGRGEWRSACWLRQQIRQESTRLVFLNCCKTAVTGRARLSGVATALMECGVPAVIGMALAVPDDFARRFAEGFYRHLFEQLAAERAPRLDVCVREARRWTPSRDAESDPTWILPVLFVRSGEERLFEVERARAPGGDVRRECGAGVVESRYRGAILPDSDFSGRPLSGWDFSRADLRRASFREADLTGACFRDAVLAEADFRGAVLENTDLHGATCTFLKFNSAVELVQGTLGWKQAVWSSESLQRLLEAEAFALGERSRDD